MKLYIDTDEVEFRVSKGPDPKLDAHGIQRTDKASGALLWSTQVFALDESGGEILTITTAGEKPDVKVGMIVEADRLEAIPWASTGRSGVAFRADAVYFVDDDE